MPSDVPNMLPDVDGPVSFVVVSANAPLPQRNGDKAAALEKSLEDAHILKLNLAEGKKDQLAFLQVVLPAATRFIKERLARGDAICVCCATGKDASVGIALAALQLFFDDRGQLLQSGAAGAWSRFHCEERTICIIADSRVTRLHRKQGLDPDATAMDHLEQACGEPVARHAKTLERVPALFSVLPPPVNLELASSKYPDQKGAHNIQFRSSASMYRYVQHSQFHYTRTHTLRLLQLDRHELHARR